MIKQLRSGEAEIQEFIVAAALVGIRYWRPGDVMEARNIIGTVAYKKVLKRLSPQRVGDLFYMAVEVGDLPLVCLGKNTAKYYVYALIGDVTTPVAKPTNNGSTRHLRVLGGRQVA
ncbi:hypothetical protein [Marinobacterium rhizophilum]|uniref:hypothetical protein n=1 Tax=Marinobacterium rhizophilum TaxID=420402 RepID=UPI00037B76B3|nr:hypothetical protein [Marinobacterium rhizophilum]